MANYQLGEEQISALLAYVISFIATRLLISAHLNDAPDEDRKAHRVSKATGGGLAIIMGFCAALIYYISQGFVSSYLHYIISSVAFGLAFGFVGFIDDLINIKSKVRMLILLILCFGLSLAGLNIKEIEFFPNVVLKINPYISAIITIFWAAVIVNAVNFMDGANGLSFGTNAVSICGLLFLFFLHNELFLATICIMIFAAIAGFLTYNVAKGNIFAGDVGSWFLGGIIASLVLLAIKSGVPIFIALICFFPVLADVALTILYRIKIGENILSAHNKHIYQLIIRSGNGHIQTSIIYWLQAIVCCMIAIATDKFIPHFSFLVFLCLILIYAVIFSKMRQKLQNKIEKNLIEKAA